MVLLVGLGALLWQCESGDDTSEGESEPVRNVAKVDAQSPIPAPIDVPHDGPGLRFVDADGVSRAVDTLVGAPGMWPPVEKQVEARRVLPLPEIDASTTSGRRRARSYEVIARNDRRSLGFWGGISLDDFAEDARSNDQAQVALDRASPLRVRVVGPADTPVEGAEVRLSRDLVSLAHLSHSTDGEGRAEFRAIPGGDYRLSVRAPGFVQRIRHLLHTHSDATIEVQLDHGATVTGRVVSRSGAGIPRATIEVIPVGAFADDTAGDVDEESVDPGFLSQIGVASQVTTADSNGEFSVAGIEAGAIRVRVDAAGYVPALSNRVRVVRGSTVDVGTVELRPGQSVEARVVDEDGDPVQGATVRWSAPNSALGDAVLSDSEGRATLEGVPAMASIRAELDEWRSAEVTPGRPDDSDTIAVELVLRRPDELPDLMVRLLSDDPEVTFESVVLVGEADGEGTNRGRQRCVGERVDPFDWRFAQCAPGELTLEASTDEFGTATWEGDFDDTTEVTIGAPPGVEATFTGLQGPQWDGSALRWRPTAGPWEDADFDTEAFDGRVWSHKLFDGRYQVEFDNPTTGAVRETFEVDGGAVSFEVELAARRQVELYVVDSNGTPVSGALMQVWQGGQRVFEATSRGADPVRVELPTPFDGALVAFDGRLGEGRVPVELAEDGEAESEYVARLSDDLFAIDLPGRIQQVDQIEDVLGVELVRDDNAWLVDPLSQEAPAVQAGIARGDRLVWLRQTDDGYIALVERGQERRRVRVPSAE